MFKRLVVALVCLSFILSNIQIAVAQLAASAGEDFSVSQLPVPGTMVGESAPFVPLALKGLVVNPQKPLEFQFIVDTGNSLPPVGRVREGDNQEQLKTLIKYFLAGLTIPEGDLWVNLSPYEKNRMVPEALGQTDLGRDLLAQDYILKQLTASLIYPEKDLGREFWSRVYSKAQAQFGTTNVPVNTFNKVWILPNQAQVFENNNAAYVTKSTLKVMLDEDYLALGKNQRRPGDMFKSELQGTCPQAGCQASIPLKVKAPQGNNDTHSIASQIIREIILPEIEKEVNTGKNFAPLRQIYQALILAKWYKETIQNGLLDTVYTNKNKVAGVNLNDPNIKEQIYERYLMAYKKGAFNFIKEDPLPDGQEVPRKYFSGGITKLEPEHIDRNGRQTDVKSDGAMISLTVGLVAAGKVNSRLKINRAMDQAMQVPKQTPDALEFPRLNYQEIISFSNEEFPRLRPFVAYLNSKKGQSGRAGKGYHSYEHPLEINYLVYHVLKAMGFDEKDLQLAYVAVALHDLDIRPPDTAPKVSRTLEQLENDTEFREILSNLADLGITWDKVKAIIYRTDFPWTQEHIDKLEKMLEAFDANEASTLRRIMEVVQILDKSAFNLYLTPQETGERLKGLQTELANEGSSRIVDAVSFMDDTVAKDPSWPEVWNLLPSWAKDNWNTNRAYFDRAKLQTPQTPDTAMSGVPNNKTALTKDLGGIDLNQIKVNNAGKTINVQFDQAQLNELMQGGFEGFLPVITNITHISSPFQLLGIRRSDTVL